MTNFAHAYGAALADVDFAALKRTATVERADAMKQFGRSIAAWLRRGLALRYHDDAVTHPTAGKLCGC